MSLSVMWPFFLVTVLCAPFPPDESSELTAGPPPNRSKQSHPRCQLLFSEISLVSEDTGHELPFVELKSECQAGHPGPMPKNQLSGYRLYVIQMFPLAVVSVVDFDLFDVTDLDQIKYILIGSPRLERTDISLASPRVQSVFSKSIDIQMLPNPTKSKYSMIITYGITKSASKNFHLYINPDGLALPKLISKADSLMLINTVVDTIFLYSDQGEHEHFSSLMWSVLKKSTAKYFTTWNEFLSFSTDFSLSVCQPNYEGFNAASFKRTKRTPGKSNLCEELRPVLLQHNHHTYCATPKTPTYTEDDNSLNQGKQMHFVSLEQILGAKAQVFQPSWKETCQRHFPMRDKILQTPSIENWISFQTEEQSCRFSCKVCQFYYAIGFRPDVKKKPDIVKGGYISRDKYENSDQIKTHEKQELHLQALQFYKEMMETTTEDQINVVIRKLENREKIVFNSTMNSIVMLYTLVKSGLSFQKYEPVMKALQQIGANVGFHHHNPVAAHYINEIISSTFRKNVIASLVENGNYFSILGDGSTIIKQAYLIIYIQTTRKGEPVTYFYALLHLSKGEKGKAMADTVMERVEADELIVPNFKKYFNDFLACIVSDGAANMVGKENSFKTHLSQHVGRPLPNVECSADKLDNAVKFGIKSTTKEIATLKDSKIPEDQEKLRALLYFEGFEKKTNNFYNFYQSRGHKKWMHLVQTAEDLNLSPKTLKYFFEVRWSESHFNALDTIRHDYPALVEDLSEIQTASDFLPSARATAAELYQTMADITYAITLHEFLDLLQVFKHASKQFQEGSSIIVGKIAVVRRVIEELTKLMAIPGAFVTNFLSKCTCNVPFVMEDLSLAQYDFCNKVTFDGIFLTHQITNPVKLSVHRRKLYSDLIAGVRHYFKIDLLESFEVFNPINLKAISTNDENGQTVGLDLLYQDNGVIFPSSATLTTPMKIRIICHFYILNNEECNLFEAEWTRVLTCLTQTDLVRDEKLKEAPKFWSKALMTCSAQWTPITTKVLGMVLSTPHSAAECERGFSVVNRIKTKERSRMDKITLDNLARVKINGPEISRLDAYELSVNFLKHYARVDDSENNGGRKSSENYATSSSPNHDVHE